jgi:acyl-CoA reductase-like NAD-dependent aldehyde dehydrogenase
MMGVSLRVSRNVVVRMRVKRLRLQNAVKIAKKVPLHQRCAWLNDVASKLREQREEFAKVLCDEVGKPIAYARIEVDRCIETITLSAETMRTMNGETINTDAMSSGRSGSCVLAT